jgi:hypothetical protein
MAKGSSRRPAIIVFGRPPVDLSKLALFTLVANMPVSDDLARILCQRLNRNARWARARPYREGIEVLSGWRVGGASRHGLRRPGAAVLALVARPRNNRSTATNSSGARCRGPPCAGSASDVAGRGVALAHPFHLPARRGCTRTNPRVGCQSGWGERRTHQSWNERTSMSLLLTRPGHSLDFPCVHGNHGRKDESGAASFRLQRPIIFASSFRRRPRAASNT